ncbi:MAG: 2-oxoacid:acceptor oxidoreductase family protein, partial [Candidatus Aminicenantes bacterium]|nr:2-oxoacid:acceptor oxidoreductase family protein [Candidatus Aminicenantes bacterium]
MSNKFAPDNSDVSVVLCGQAGQGIQTVERILVRLLKLSGFNVFATKEYMSRVRGGSNSTEIRVSSQRISAFVDRMDILIPFHKGALNHVQKRISPQTLILGDEEIIPDDFQTSGNRYVPVPFAQIASELGGKIFVNIVAAGVVTGMFQVEQSLLGNFIRKFFAEKSGEVVQKNIEAIKRGWEIGRRLLDSQKSRLESWKKQDVSEQILLSGAEAVGLGALAGGCNFLS